jgi:hypothetical protein
MSNEIIHIVTYDHYDDFQHINFIFSQNFISLFLGLFNDKTNLWGRYFSSDYDVISLCLLNFPSFHVN